IVTTVQSGSMSTEGIGLPFWVLAIGAVGIALGLALFGPRLIKTVGEQITKLNEIRAYCIAFSAAVTVLAASALGMPVSSTHIAVGGIFGVGFLREYYSRKEMEIAAVPIFAKHIDATLLNASPQDAIASARRTTRRKLVRRQSVMGIVGAWGITVPASAISASLIYWALAFLVGN